MQVTRRLSDVDRRLLLLLIPSLSLLVLFSLSSLSLEPFNFAPLRSLIYNRTLATTATISNRTESHDDDSPPIAGNESRDGESSSDTEEEIRRGRRRREEVMDTRIAVCLVGGARRFELTGPSIVEKILKVYPNSDLFLNSPLDKNFFSVTYWTDIIIIRFSTYFPNHMVLQGLLQYFNLVEGCLTMINSYQTQNNFTYDWIIRTRVDGYWTDPLDPENFVPGHYLVPPGSSYGGLNDRLGIGNFPPSAVALSRLSLIPDLDSAGLTRLNSESAFKAQLTTKRVPYVTKPLPFCIVSDRTYDFPPSPFGVPVASLLSPGPLSGAKCRPCTATCVGTCVEEVMERLNREWSWTEWRSVNGTTTKKTSLELCDARGEWEEGWEKVFDEVVGENLARARREVVGEDGLEMKRCVEEFEEMRTKAVMWEAPIAEEICVLGLGPK
ncbi:PREDICTED: uncharacterized protein LOC104813245 [Tarenaya hassleriana]|uniref:uncharacterized protein LOC104813245 n=1 Tax=Tarenaya hassleriana TaxID=28532 RepID=UPI00053C1FA6|nr:PREDICTED: uncharacterized protein LOC104813245 [Tarenaya hassleriana]